VNDLLVPAGSRATNPSIRQRNFATTTTWAGDYNVLDSSIFQVQDGDVDIELATAIQQASSTQEAVVYSPAEQINLLNKAHWLGVEPPPDAVPAPTPAPAPAPRLGPSPGPGPGPAGPESGPDAGPGTQSRSAGPGGTLPPTVRVFHSTTLVESGGSQHIQSHVTTTIKTGSGGHEGTTGTGTGSVQDSSGDGGGGSHHVPLGPGDLGLTELGPGPGTEPGAVVSSEPQPGLGAGSPASNPRDESVPERPSSGSAGPAAPAGPGTPCCGSSTDLGAAGFAPPSGGSSAPALALPIFKLAAPAPIGPQMSAPTLGRSVAFPEPFERPG
jgi:hypothetical protein